MSVDLSSALVHRLGWTLVHSLWQIAAVVAVVALGLVMARRRSSQARYVLACAGFLMAVALPIATFLLVPAKPARVPVESSTGFLAASDSSPARLALPNAPARSVAIDTMPEVVAGQNTTEMSVRPTPSEPAWERFRNLAEPWLSWLVIAWLAGVALLSVWNFGGWIAAERLKWIATAPGIPALEKQVLRLRTQMEIRCSTRVLLSRLADVPIVVGWLKPVILVPAGLLANLTPAELDALLAHELAHIRRHDYVVNLLQTVAEMLLFYHPAIWWLSRQIRAEREYCCDDEAAIACGSKIEYVKALEAVARHRSAPGLAMAATGNAPTRNPSMILLRVRRLLGISDNRHRGLITSSAISLAIVTFVTAAIILAMSSGQRTEAREGAGEGAGAQDQAVERAQPEDLELEARVAGIGGSSPERSSITFWKAVDRATIQDSDTGRADGDSTEPHVWHDPSTGTYWTPIHNFATSDRATKEKLGAGDYRVTASIGHGNPAMLGVSEPVHLDGSRQRTVVSVTIQEGPSLQIDAIDASTGEAVDYAAIRLVRSDGLPVVSWSSGSWSISAKGGQHTFEHLAPGDYTLEVVRPAYRYGERRLAAERRLMEIHLVAGENRRVSVKLIEAEPDEEEVRRRWPWVVTGTVRDAQGAPLEGVQIRASCGWGTLRPTGETLSDQQGNYTLRFGPGMRTRSDDGTWGAGFQAATIFASKSGYTEKDLCRQGDLLMGDKLPENGESFFNERNRIVVPNELRRLDFVMCPAGSLEGELVDEHGQPISDRQVLIQGKQLPPSSSVLADGKTDEQGRFRFEGVPTNFDWWFTMGDAGRTPPIRLLSPVVYRVKVQLARFDQYNLDVFQIISVTDPQGTEVRDQVLGDEPSARPPVSEELQAKGRSYLSTMAAACRDWLGPPSADVKTYEYRFHFLEAEPKAEGESPDTASTHTIQDASRAKGAVRQGITYFGTPHILASRPEKVVFRQVDEKDDTIVLNFFMLDSVKIAAGNGVTGRWRGYFSTPLREGLIVLDKSTHVPVRTEIGGVREVFSQYLDLGDGRFAPLAIGIEHDAQAWNWTFQVYQPGLWLLSESRTPGEGGGSPVVKVDEVKVNGEPAVPVVPKANNEAAAAKSPAPQADAAQPRGRVVGKVVNDATGEPMAKAFVAVDHSGDAGGSNLERFREEGIYITVETDIAGQFVLERVALMPHHPLMVTHPGFVRYEQSIALSAEQPQVELEIRLKPAATVVVTAVDAQGQPLHGQTLLRLEAKQGLPFKPLREDWPALSYQTVSTNDGEYSFGELDSGEYSVEVMQQTRSATTYHGTVSPIAVSASETKTVSVPPSDSRSHVTLEIAADPYSIAQMQHVMVVVARDPGLLVWQGHGRFYHPEDHRLGRIMRRAWLQTPVMPADAVARYELHGLPPARYAVFAITAGAYPNFGSPSVCVRGAAVDITGGGEQTIRIPWTNLLGPSRCDPATVLSLDARVALQARPYSAKELDELMTGAADGNAQFIVDASIGAETVAVPPSDVLSIGDLLEALHRERGWIVQCEDRTYVLRPQAAQPPESR